MALSASAGSVGALNGYFGQYGSESLRTYCDSGIDFVTLGFVNKAPENELSGYPGTNFAGHCQAGVYENAAGVPSNLLSNCLYIKGDIPYCQERGVKVLLSIGGVYNPITSNYEVTTEENGDEFADFLYHAFGPYDPSWTGPRPFDTETEHAAVDGFDFDIEEDFENTPYIAMIETFRALDSSLFITGAPQCPTSTTYFYMKEMIQKASFDALFIQFYNNPVCDAIERNTLDPGEKFNYDDWEDIVAGSDKSKTAKLFVGLPSSPLAAGSGYISPEELKEIVCDLKDKPHFGGISLWDLTRGADNLSDGKDYNQHALDAVKYGCDPVPTTTTSASVSSTTASSTASTTSDVTTTSTASESTTSSEASTTTSEASTTTSEASATTSDALTTSSEVSTPSSVATSTTASSSLSSHWSNSTTSSTVSSTTSSTIFSLTSSDLPASSSTLSSTLSSFTGLPTSGWNATMTSSTASSTDDGSSPTTTNGGSNPTITTNGGSNPTITTSSSVEMTTSTSFTTSVHTVTKCPPYVVDCPEGGYVTTETIPVFTTVCPVSDLPTTTKAATTPMTTSTVYTTNTYTITACPPEVTNCPVGSVTTETIPLYTTVCPLTETEHVPAPTGPAPTGPAPTGPAPTGPAPSGPAPSGPAGPGEEVPPAEESTTTTKVTGTIYTTVVVSAPTSIETLTISKPSSAGCSGPGCPGAALPTESWTGKPPVSPTSPTSPPTAGASVLGVGMAGLVALLAVQVLVL